MKNPRQRFVAALHPKLIKSDLSQLGAKFAFFGGQKFQLRGAQCRLVGIGIGEVENRARLHYSPNLEVLETTGARSPEERGESGDRRTVLGDVPGIPAAAKARQLLGRPSAAKDAESGRRQLAAAPRDQIKQKIQYRRDTHARPVTALEGKRASQIEAANSAWDGKMCPH